MKKSDQDKLTLFSRIHKDIFRPLVGINQELAWALIERIYQRFFGLDATPPEGDGFSHRDISMEIERFILTGKAWQSEDGEFNDNTPLNIQANAILSRLVETGWLRSDKVGVKTFISMHPNVISLFNHLHKFSNEGPQLIGGKVQMIYNQLQSVYKNPREQAQGFKNASQEASLLIESLNTIVFRVRDMFESVGREDKTEVYIRHLFEKFISNIYLRDYKQLRTENHPLKHKYAIIELVESLRDDAAKYSELVAGYQDVFNEVDDNPKDILDADIEKFLRFINIDHHLRRLDTAISDSTSKYVTQLKYKLKVSDDIESSINRAIASLISEQESGVEFSRMPQPIGVNFSVERLREPVTRAKPQPRTIIKKRELTPFERASSELRKLMIENRVVRSGKLISFIERNLKEKELINANEFEITSVQDASLFLALSKIAHINRIGKKYRDKELQIPFDIEFVPEQNYDNGFLEGRMFTVKRKVIHA